MYEVSLSCPILQDLNSDARDRQARRTRYKTEAVFSVATLLKATYCQVAAELVAGH